jgi:hypothetical protein
MVQPSEILGFGTQADWATLYDERYQCSLDLDIAVQRNEANLAQAKSGQLSYAEIGVLALESDNMMEAAGNQYDAVAHKVRTAEIEVGQYMQSTEATMPAYITRAISQATPDLPAEHWLQIGGAIEAFRFTTGQTDTGLILGEGTGEAWSTDALGNIVNDIQHLQLLQIATSSDPRKTASHFNRDVVIGDLGLPPALPVNELSWDRNTWLGRALRLTKVIEPPQYGLLDDILR